jgi:riboflavin synthase
MELCIDAGSLQLATSRVGDSIAVAGVCLTATRFDAGCFFVDVSNETLSKTTLGRLQVGSQVNLERALLAGGALGGHYVTGHVDGVGKVIDLRADGRSWRLSFSAPDHLMRYVAQKGSVTIEGTSLTVNEVSDAFFGVNLVPHTWEVTTLGALRVGDEVNIEIDIIARYVERLLLTGSTPRG